MRNKLIAFRGDRNQSEMAKIYGVTQQTWSNWERGILKPNLVTMKQIEKDSGIPMEVIFFDAFNKKIRLKEKSA